MSVADLPDPRVWPATNVVDAAAANLHALASASVDAKAGQAALRAKEAMRVLDAMLAADGAALANAFAAAPTVVIARQLWRLLADCERGDSEPERSLRTTILALPVVLVAAVDGRGGRVTQPGVVPDVRGLEALLRDAGEFGGAQTFALSPTLSAADAIDLAALPALLRRRAPDRTVAEDALCVDCAPAPFEAYSGSERVHLRFVVAAVLTAPGVDPVRASSIGRWGAPFAHALARGLAVPGLSLLALPRPPGRLVPALQLGRAAQRDVSAQLFASNAIRRFRATVGEPTAIISAHRAAGAPGGGELRLSLSSPFAPSEAEGFRCPLYPYEPVQDVAAMLVGLLRDCRVQDVGVRAGLHADVDPLTGGPLLFKDAGATSACQAP